MIRSLTEKATLNDLPVVHYYMIDVIKSLNVSGFHKDHCK